MVEHDSLHPMHGLMVRRLGDGERGVVTQLERRMRRERDALNLEVMQELVTRSEVVEQDDGPTFAQKTREGLHVDGSFWMQQNHGVSWAERAVVERARGDDVRRACLFFRELNELAEPIPIRARALEGRVGWRRDEHQN